MIALQKRQNYSVRCCLIAKYVFELLCTKLSWRDLRYKRELEIKLRLEDASIPSQAAFISIL